MGIQYAGFAVVAGGREYSFLVPGPDNMGRAFTMLIQDSAFRRGMLKYQEGPDLCYRKLLSALAAEEGKSPLRSRQQVTESEVVEYTALGRTKGRNWTEEQRQAARLRFRAGLAERRAR